MKKILLALLGLFLALVGYLMLWPVAIDPVEWTAPVAPAMTGDYAPNSRLGAVTRVDLTDGHGPEDVDVDAAGRIYGGLQDGRIMRYQPSSSAWETFVDTGGRPLGLHFDADGNLIVADAFKGLLSVDVTGQISVLSSEADGVLFAFVDDLDIGLDGTIYFSDASFKFDQSNWMDDGMEHRPNGRLLAYNPDRKTTEVLLSDLYFANGVAVSPEGDFVLVNETWEYRVTRYWLTGEKKGSSEPFIENLPGFPDGISSNGKGTYWLALPTVRNPDLDGMADKPFLRKVVARLPSWMQPVSARYAFILGLDGEGRVIHNLQEPSGNPYAMITSVQEHQGTLYLGSLQEPAFAFLPAPETPAPLR